MTAGRGPIRGVDRHPLPSKLERFPLPVRERMKKDRRVPKLGTRVERERTCRLLRGGDAGRSRWEGRKERRVELEWRRVGEVGGRRGVVRRKREGRDACRRRGSRERLLAKMKGEGELRWVEERDGLADVRKKKPQREKRLPWSTRGRLEARFGWNGVEVVRRELEQRWRRGRWLKAR